MEARMKSYKRKFDSNLKHVKLILLQYRETLPESQWQILFEETRQCILKHPTHFLTGELPDSKTLTLAVDLVFSGFQRDLHVRKVQAFRKFNYLQ